MESQTLNKPRLRFPEFKDNWSSYKMGSVYSFKVTNSLSREKLNYLNGSVKNIHYGDIHTKFQTLLDVTKEKLPFINIDVPIDRISNENYCCEGDLIIADASEDLNDVGKSIELVNLNGERVLAGLHTILARPTQKKLSLGFGGYLFTSNNVRRQIQHESQGSKVTSISAVRLSKIDLNIPSLPEQQKISSLLTLVDTKIQQLTKKQTLLEQYKKGVMQKIFNQEIRFKDENGKVYPVWEKRMLRDIATFFSGGTPLTTKKTYYGGDIPFIKSGEINSEKTEQFITNEGLVNSSAKKIKKGDLLYALYGATSGEVGISKLDGAINQAVLCLRSDYFVNYFLYSFLKLNKSKIVGKFLQGGQGNLSAEIIKELKISLPSKEEQIKISDFLSALDRKIDCNNTLIEKTKLWKKGLLQQLFV